MATDVYGVDAAEYHHCRRRDGPVVVGVFDVVFNNACIVATAFRSGHHLGEDALLVAELPQSGGVSQYVFVVRGDDEVFAAFFTASNGFIEEVVIMRFGQHVAVDDQVAQDAVPSGIAVSCISKLSVATFKTDFDVHVINDFQSLSNGVVAEWRHADHHHVEAADLGGLGDGDVLFWEIGILPENAHVFLHLWLPDGGVALQSSGGQEIDAAQGLATFLLDFDSDCCTFRNGDVVVLKRQVGHALGKGAETAFQCDFLPFDLAVVKGGDGDFGDGILQRECCGGAGSGFEALWRISAETIDLLRVHDIEC